MLPDRSPSISFLLGKPVRANTVFPEVFSRLSAMGVNVSVHLPATGTRLPDDVLRADLLVQRGLSLERLRSIRGLEVEGKRCCNPVRSTKLLANRMRTIDLLAGGGLPVPQTVQLATWSSVQRYALGRQVVVKAVDAQVGRGSRVLVAPDGHLPECAPYEGPFVVQNLIDGGDTVYKLYVAGPRVQGLLKPAGEHNPGLGKPFQVDDDLSALALRAGLALDLDIYGVDLLYGADGPVIVDVNPFPGFRGVPGAAGVIADHLGALAFAARGTRMFA